MKKHIYYNSLIAFFGGLFGVSILFIFWYLVLNVGRFEVPFPPTLLGYFLTYLLYYSIIEEGIKFLLIKQNIGQFPYGFLLGFGFGVGETALLIYTKLKLFISIFIISQFRVLSVSCKKPVNSFLFWLVLLKIVCYNKNVVSDVRKAR